MTFHYKVLYFRLAGSQGGDVQSPCRKRPYVTTPQHIKAQSYTDAEQKMFIKADGWGKNDQSNLYNLVPADALASPLIALDSSLVSRFKTSIFENVVTRARADTDKDSMVESKLTLQGEEMKIRYNAQIDH